MFSECCGPEEPTRHEAALCLRSRAAGIPGLRCICLSKAPKPRHPAKTRFKTRRSFGNSCIRVEDSVRSSTPSGDMSDHDQCAWPYANKGSQRSAPSIRRRIHRDELRAIRRMAVANRPRFKRQHILPDIRIQECATRRIGADQGIRSLAAMHLVPWIDSFGAKKYKAVRIYWLIGRFQSA